MSIEEFYKKRENNQLNETKRNIIFLYRIKEKRRKASKSDVKDENENQY